MGGAHLRARTVQRTRSEWACRSCAAVSSRSGGSTAAAAGAPGDADVVVDAGGGGWAAGAGGKGREAGGAQLGRHRCAGASTAKGQGHGWGVQWLAGGWLAAGAVQLERMSSGLGASADPSIAVAVELRRHRPWYQQHRHTQHKLIPTNSAATPPPPTPPFTHTFVPHNIEHTA